MTTTITAKSITVGPKWVTISHTKNVPERGWRIARFRAIKILSILNCLDLDYTFAAQFKSKNGKWYDTMYTVRSSQGDKYGYMAGCLYLTKRTAVWLKKKLKA